MSSETDLKLAVDKVLDFYTFFISLGDMAQTDLLIAIENRNPEFADYFAKLSEAIETPLDFFRVYAGWAIRRIHSDYIDIWDAVKEITINSETYNILKMQCTYTTVLWDILEKIFTYGGDK